MDDTLQELIRTGVVGLVLVLVITGWLRPKWSSDEAAKREEKKDQIIERLTAAVERLADKIEGK